MKKRILTLWAVYLFAGLVARSAPDNFGISCPGVVASGVSYYVGLQATTYLRNPEEYSNNRMTLYKNGTYFASTYGNGGGEGDQLSCGDFTTDSGAQTVGYLGYYEDTDSDRDGSGGWSTSASVSVFDLPPSCSSITNSGSPADGTSFEVYANNVQNSWRVRFPTWTDVNGQDELIWYEGQYDWDNNRWKCTVPISEHNGEYGSYATHVYAQGADGGWVCLGGTSVTLNVPPPPHMEQVWADNVGYGQTTTLRARVTDPDSNLQWVDFYVSGPALPSGWNRVGRVNISGGDATAQLAWRPPHSGEYAVHARAGDSMGYQDSEGLVGVFSMGLPPAPSCVSISNSGSPVYSSCFIVYANNVQNATRVVFPVWTDANGQDEVIWHEGTYNAEGNYWYAYVDRSSHKNEYGNYTVHVYADDLEHRSYYLGETNVTLNTPPSPQTISVSANDILLGQTVTFNGRATDVANSLQEMQFYIHRDPQGDGLYNQWWHGLGTISINGGDATAQKQFFPLLPGDYAVHIRAQNSYGQWDSNANIVTGFTVREPIVRPPSSSQRIEPSDSLFLARVNDTIIVTNGSWIDIYGNSGGESTYWEYDESFYWTGTAWSSLGKVGSFNPSAPGLYSAGGKYVYVLHSPVRPTATISTNKSEIYVGETATISAVFSPGQYDNMTNTNIDSPVGTGLLDWSTPSNKTYTFTPSKPGTYTFYARIATTCFDAATYATVTVVVPARPPHWVSLSVDDVNLGQSMKFRGHVTDLDGDLHMVRFWVVAGPGYPPWTMLKSIDISGGDATFAVDWVPGNPGTFEVSAYVIDREGKFETEIVKLLVHSADTDSDADGMPDMVEIALGLDPKVPNAPPTSKIKSYDYDKLNQLKKSPEGDFQSDKEGNINVKTP